MPFAPVDYYTNTVEDAADFEQHFGEDYSPDEAPERYGKCSWCGSGLDPDEPNRYRLCAQCLL